MFWINKLSFNWTRFKQVISVILALDCIASSPNSCLSPNLQTKERDLIWKYGCQRCDEVRKSNWRRAHSKGKFADRHTQEDYHMKMKAWFGMLLPDVKDASKPPEARRRACARFFLPASRRIQPCWHTDLELLTSRTIRQ